jgi:hypothetical protein
MSRFVSAMGWLHCGYRSAAAPDRPTGDICSEAAFRDKKMLQENGSRQGNFPQGDVDDNPIKSDIGAVAIVRNCPPLNVDYLRK